MLLLTLKTAIRGAYSTGSLVHVRQGGVEVATRGVSARISFAIAPGSYIFLAIVVVILLSLVIGFYTRRGSGIDEHPSDGLDGAPGAEGRSEVSGKDQGEGSAFDTHGTR